VGEVFSTLGNVFSYKTFSGPCLSVDQRISRLSTPDRGMNTVGKVRYFILTTNNPFFVWYMFNVEELFVRKN